MPVFVDTNVLLYARDAGEPDKQPIARAWLDSLWRTREGRTSYQVLSEYYITATRKLSPGLDRDQARADIEDLMVWRPVAIDGGVLTGAWQIEQRYGVSWWDSLIVSAAQICGCERLLTEDLQDGQDFEGLVVVNPFLHDPTT